tara:strand:+ start:1151 stop:1459 length:309 start_codon:yes stop_codon:yes gene_type:complete
MTLIPPRVHLNGTAKMELIEQLNEAIDALEKALEAYWRASPHGRDYLTDYTASGDRLYVSARDAYQATGTAMRNALLDLNELRERVWAQPDNRPPVNRPVLA